MARGFAGKPGGQVGADGGVRQRSEHALHPLTKVVAIVTSAHRGEDRIGPGLQRQVEMRAEFAIARDQLDDFVTQLFRIERTDAKTSDGRSLGQHLEQFGKADLRNEVLAVAAQMHPRKSDLLEAARGELVDGGDYPTR